MKMVWLAALGLAISGCGDYEPSSDLQKAEALPAELQKLQGRWCSVSTNKLMLCDVTIDQYTVRLKYKRTPEDALLKKNVMISEVDVQQHMLLINGGTAGWPYSLSRQGDQSVLNLEFYNNSTKKWIKVYLRRVEEPHEG